MHPLHTPSLVSRIPRALPVSKEAPTAPLRRRVYASTLLSYTRFLLDIHPLHPRNPLPWIARFCPHDNAPWEQYKSPSVASLRSRPNTLYVHATQRSPSPLIERRANRTCIGQTPTTTLGQQAARRAPSDHATGLLQQQERQCHATAALQNPFYLSDRRWHQKGPTRLEDKIIPVCVGAQSHTKPCFSPAEESQHQGKPTTRLPPRPIELRARVAPREPAPRVQPPRLNHTSEQGQGFPPRKLS